MQDIIFNRIWGEAWNINSNLQNVFYEMSAAGKKTLKSKIWNGRNYRWWRNLADWLKQQRLDNFNITISNGYLQCIIKCLYIVCSMEYYIKIFISQKGIKFYYCAYVLKQHYFHFIAKLKFV